MQIETKSSEINKMIYDYLLERGLNHSAFVFSRETNINNSADTSFNHLLTLINKGKLYEEMENDCEKDISNELEIDENEDLNDFIDKKIEEKFLTIEQSHRNSDPRKIPINVSGKENPVFQNGHRGKLFFSYQIFKNNLFALEKEKGLFFLIDFDDNEKNQGINKLSNFYFEGQFEVLYLNHLIFYNKDKIFFFNRKNFEFIKSFDLEDQTKLQDCIYLRDFYILLFTDCTILLNNDFSYQFCLKQKINNFARTKNSVFLFNIRENQILKYSLNHCKFFELKIPHDFDILTLGSNSEFETLVVFGRNQKDNKNIVLVYIEDLLESVLSFQIKEFLNKIKVFENKKILFFAEKSLFIFDLKKLNFVFKKKFKNHTIVNIEWVSETDFIIEFLGNNFQKVNITDESFIEFERNGKDYYMVLDVDFSRIIEIENIESYNIIKI